MRVFLTGVSGYLGGIVAGDLSQVPEVEGITGIDVATPKAPLPANVRFAATDVRSPRLADLVAGHDVIVHTAFVVRWPAGMSDAERREINLHGTQHLARTAAATRARQLIYFSSAAAYDPAALREHDGVTEATPLGDGTSASYYANDKAMAERLVAETLRESGTTLTIFRPAQIVGSRHPGTVAYLRGLRDGPLDAVLYAGHDPRHQYLHEDDVAAAVRHAIGTGISGAYNLVPDDWLRWSDVLKTLGRRSTLTVPVWVARAWTTVAWRLLRGPIHPSWVDLALADVTFDNAKLKATGWRPRYDTADALRAALAAAAPQPAKE